MNYLFLYKLKFKPEILEELSLSEFNDFWIDVSALHVLSEQFIEKYLNKVNWNCISIHQNLSLEFLIKHKDKIDLVYLNLIRKYPKKLKINS